MARYDFEPLPHRPNISHARTGISTLRHDFAGDRLQFVSGVFSGVAHHGGVRNQPHRRANQPSRFDHRSHGISAPRKPDYCFRVSGEARTGSLETGASGMDWNAAGRFSGDAAADGGDSSNLWGSGEAGVFAPATSGIGVATSHDCTTAGSGDIGGSWTADPAVACAGTGPATHPAGVVDDFLSCGGDCAGDAGAYGDLSRGSAGRGTDAKRLAGGDGGDIVVVAGKRSVRILRAASALQCGLRRTCGGYRIDGVDAAIGGDHISGGGVECGIGREPAWSACP